MIAADVRITRQRGELLKTTYADVTLATDHPSAILRPRDAAVKSGMCEWLVDDLRAAVSHATAAGG